MKFFSYPKDKKMSLRKGGAAEAFYKRGADKKGRRDPPLKRARHHSKQQRSRKKMKEKMMMMMMMIKGKEVTPTKPKQETILLITSWFATQGRCMTHNAMQDYYYSNSSTAHMHTRIPIAVAYLIEIDRSMTNPVQSNRYGN